MVVVETWIVADLRTPAVACLVKQHDAEARTDQLGLVTFVVVAMRLDLFSGMQNPRHGIWDVVRENVSDADENRLGSDDAGQVISIFVDGLRVYTNPIPTFLVKRIVCEKAIYRGLFPRDVCQRWNV